MTIKNILLMFLMLALFLTGFLVGRFTVSPVLVGEKQTVQDVSKQNTNANSEAVPNSSTTNQTQEQGSVAVGAKMTDAQRKMLTSFGLDPDKIVITESMLSCAEAKVGAKRIEEIKNGATPSIIEGASLLGCYSK